MAAIVDIDQPLTELSLAEGERRSLVFDLVNVADRPLHVTVTTSPEPPERAATERGRAATVPDWVKLAGEPTFRLGPKETRKIELEVAPPEGTTATTTCFRLKVYEVSLPEENNSFSEPVEVTVAAAAAAEDGHKPPWKRIGAIAAAVLLLVVAGSGWLAYGWLNPPLLPDVEGRPLSEAIAMLQDAGIARAAIREERPLVRDADGRVTKQEPAAGASIAAHTVVILTVPRQSEMPDVVGTTLDTARESLVAAGIDARQIDIERAIGREAGRVIGQSPASGTRLEPDVPVTLTLSALGMPAVVGQPLGAALSALEEIGIAGAAVTVDRPVGRTPVHQVIDQVTEQAPGPGVLLEAGSAVTLTAPRPPEMPDVVGHAQATALERLAAAGIPRAEVQIEQPIEPNADLSVTRQSPSAGTRIGPATTVSLTVPRRPGTLTLPRLSPDATGQTAVSTYRGVGLQVDLTEDRNAPGRDPGRVIEVLPPPGSAVEENATIEVRVLSTTVNVPQYVGRIIQPAERARLDLYFVVRQETVPQRGFAMNCVLQQSHNGEVRRGTTITIRIAALVPGQRVPMGCPRPTQR